MTNSVAFGSMQVLSWLVFLFGVINLINTTLSNQMSRKQENSVLRSIGLTQKQLCKMNICEGLCYAFFATLATLIVGLPASIFACRKMSVGAFAGNVVPYQFPVLEMGLFILVLFGMELILSVWTIQTEKTIPDRTNAGDGIIVWDRRGGVCCPAFFAISQKIFEMSERCNISPRFSMKFFGRCNISRTFGFYNTLSTGKKP